ncbi:MAG: endonuclease MutS2, partial [Ignavibacteriales bacterium]|nr:endonuclease MutS2 [Ignavibacteriales bacterium]
MSAAPPHSSPIPEAVLYKLEFDKIVQRISRLTVSDVGRGLSTKILPFSDANEIRAELRRVDEAKELLIIEGAVPLDGVKNLTGSLKKASVANQFLAIQELLDVASTLRTSRVMNIFLSKRRAQYPSLYQFAEQLLADKLVEYNISQAIDEKGLVKDSASRDLRAIRQDIVKVSDQLRKKLASILKRVSEQELLQEEIITTRDGRLVVPVKVEHKNHVPGFIHTSSASGATVYIEPAETLDLNNALRELHLREEREIQRILMELTSQVREILEPLESSLRILAELDVLFAKAKYSIEVAGSRPTIVDSAKVKLIEARHPVLLQRHERSDVVPLDVELGGETRTLVITGPNAGGKSVALKTVGLLSVCAMAGIHIPASAQSEIYPFHKVFVDIGDDQSIENDLSTFSSHLHRLKEVLAEADRESLVLLDEIGAGTDPAEGGALAVSVLNELTARGTMTIATTHHGMLKVYAHETAGMANGSMEFDQSSLHPTYRFRFGIPGSSFALELAERLGIAKEILDRARLELGDEKTKLEKLIAHLERQSQEYATQLREVSLQRDHFQSLVKVYEEKMSTLKKELASIRRKAVDEAQELVKHARVTIEQSVKEIRESGAKREAVQSSRERIRELGRANREPSAEETANDVEPLRAGDVVAIIGSRETGEITEVHDDYAMVSRGNSKLKVKLRNLVKQKETFALKSNMSAENGFVLEAKKEIDVRGLMGHEAIERVQQF